MKAATIIESAIAGFKASWAARAYLLRLAVVPFALKLFCFTIALKFSGGEEGMASLRFTLILLPALLAEGWMLSHFVRTLILGQTWPFRPTGNMQADMATLHSRARGILSGMIVYVLIALAQAAIMALAATLFLPYMPETGDETIEAVPAKIGLAALAMLVFVFWGFRFLWLYIPFALNADWRETLMRLRKNKTNLFLLGVWLVCFIPFIALIQIVLPIASAFGPALGGFAIVLASVTIDLIKTIVITAGITFGLKRIFEGGEDRA